MNKIRAFFGIGRKPRKMRKKSTGKVLPDNFIVGSTNQDSCETDDLILEKFESPQKKKA